MLVIYSNFLNSTRKNGRRLPIGIFPDDLEQVIDNVTERKIASAEVTPKLIKDNAKWSPGHSMSVPE